MGLVEILTLATLTFPNALAESDGAIAISKRIQAQCEIQEKDAVPEDGNFHHMAQSWVQQHNAEKNEGSTYAKYLEDRYGIVSTLKENSLEEAALTAAIADLPPNVVAALKKLQVSDRQAEPIECGRPSQVAATDPYKNPSIAFCPENAKKMNKGDFLSLKAMFMHELGHAYAVTQKNLDASQEWMNQSKWFRNDQKEAKESCNAATLSDELKTRCGDYWFTGPENQVFYAKRPWYHEDRPPPGFASKYASAGPFEDFAETFAHYRYDQSFFESTKSDPVLARKYEFMKKLFGTSYESASACKSGAGDGGSSSTVTR